MPLPPDHHGDTRRTLSSRERRLARIIALVAGVVVIAVVISIASQGKSSSRGCLHVTFAGPVGAEQINQCGAGARSLCSTVNAAASTYSADARATIATGCRKAGLPVGA